jgi:hypothetical protein
VKNGLHWAGVETVDQLGGLWGLNERPVMKSEGGLMRTVAVKKGRIGELQKCALKN